MELDQALERLREMIADLQAKKAKEMQPWLERRAASENAGERRACGETLARIERAYTQPIETLTREAMRLYSLLPPKPIIITASSDLRHE